MAKVLAEMFSDQKTSDALYKRRQERETLQEHMTQFLERDERIIAAWLLGSVGRDNADDMSDLDVFVVVGDKHSPAVTAGRRNFTAGVGEPIIVLEAPSCAPPDGAFLTVCYDGVTGLQIVDWYWQPQSLARFWQPTKLLFDRVGLPRLDGTNGWALGKTPERTWKEAAELQVNEFWWGIAHAGKYLARSPWAWEEDAQMSWMTQKLRDTYRFFSVEIPNDAETPPWPQHPSGKVDLLRRMAALMEALMPYVEQQGIIIPKTVGPSVYRLLDVVELVCQESPVR